MFFSHENLAEKVIEKYFEGYKYKCLFKPLELPVSAEHTLITQIPLP